MKITLDVKNPENIDYNSRYYYIGDNGTSVTNLDSVEVILKFTLESLEEEEKLLKQIKKELVRGRKIKKSVRKK